MTRDANRTITDEFMLAEYDNLTSAYMDVQNGVRYQFRFYLLIAAVPFTVLAFAAKAANPPVQIDIFNLSGLLRAIFLAVPLVGFLVALSMAHTALDVILYARAVNGIRSYFLDRSKSESGNLSTYLVLPTDRGAPTYFDRRTLFWPLLTLSSTNAAYAYVAVRNFVSSSLFALFVSALFLTLHVLFFAKFAADREAQAVDGIAQIGAPLKQAVFRGEAAQASVPDKPDQDDKQK